jgi:hypothetical protein
MPRSFLLLRTSHAVSLAVALTVIAIPTLLVPTTTLGRPHATPSPSPTPVADPAITKIARQQFVEWQAGVVSKNLYADALVPELTDAKITETSKDLSQLGALTDTVFMGDWLNPTFPPGTHGYIYQMRCVEGNVYLWMAIDAQSKISRFFMRNRLDAITVTPSPSATP